MKQQDLDSEPPTTPIPLANPVFTWGEHVQNHSCILYQQPTWRLYTGGLEEEQSTFLGSTGKSFVTELASLFYAYAKGF